MSAYREWCVGRGDGGVAYKWAGPHRGSPITPRCTDRRPHGAHYFYPPTPDPLCPCEFCQGAKP